MTGAHSIRRCSEEEQPAILEIVNAGAEAYRGVIPADRWREPYMSAGELREEIDAGVTFWGYEAGDRLLGVMGIQPVQDVDLIRRLAVHYLLGNANESGEVALPIDLPLAS